MLTTYLLYIETVHLQKYYTRENTDQTEYRRYHQHFRIEADQSEVEGQFGSVVLFDQVYRLFSEYVPQIRPVLAQKLGNKTGGRE